MGFRLQQKSMTLNDLERQFHCFVVSVMRGVTKQMSLESLVFRYKVALYLCYLHIKFDDDDFWNKRYFISVLVHVVRAV